MTRNPALAWLSHPATVTAVMVLLLNDHFLKHLWPGVVTGKLSDVAGMLVAPPLLALPVSVFGFARRQPCADRLAVASLLLTGSGFALVKATPAGASLASQVWSTVAGPSVVLADVSDLVALAALGVAWWVWRRARHAAVHTGTARVMLVVPVAMFAVVATPAPAEYHADAVGTQGGVIVVRASTGLVVSRDGGATWRSESDDAALPGSGAIRPVTPGLDAGDGAVTRPVFREPEPSTKACVPGRPEHCYRVDPPAMRLSATTDGGATWTTTWQVPPQVRERLRGSCTPEDDPPSSKAVAVLPRTGGHVVVVANGCDGIAVRDPSGTWHRFTFTANLDPQPQGAPWPFTEQALPATGPPPAEENGRARSLRNSLIIAAVAGSLVCLALISVGLRRRALRRAD
ncbi:hypothetical protein [Sphaerisporangium sp. TRM90804]|uniref:hypothetical protein n=1 Tax=Sphaerisporangium sp. TRM90804 TaxID=3031113 RepID=UPI0024484D00|nr:hypothetical protein [Sphaerisporangium sp. TRM90804]MDH2425639.1 hypothetical protein [Sphaerisporangium sp. TRM90804]